jgi:hypothetical protein
VCLTGITPLLCRAVEDTSTWRCCLLGTPSWLFALAFVHLF